MRRVKLEISLAALAALAFCAGPTNAAVIIKTVCCSICVTDTKHPDACKKISADGGVVVSEDALQGLEGELGQGATIMQAGAAASPGAQQRGRRHRQGQDQDQ